MTTGRPKSRPERTRDMSGEFSRTSLLIGEEGLSRLASASILLFGVGGVGSHCAEALARCGVGRLILVDSDQVAQSNINRQAVAYQDTVGRGKTEVMAEIIARISPDIRVHQIPSFVLPDNLEELWSSIPEEFLPVDYVVDAIDTVSAKLAIAQHCHRNSIPLISSMGTGNKLHPELFEIADIYSTSVCPLCRVMRKECKARNLPGLKVLYSRETPIKPREMAGETKGGRPAPGSISFVPPAAGLMIAGHVVRDLLGLP